MYENVVYFSFVSFAELFRDVRWMRYRMDVLMMKSFAA